MNKNVILRPLNKNDIEQLRGWRNNPDNTCYLKQIPYITPQMQIDWYKRYQNDNDEICFAIIENKELNRFVGSLCLYNFSQKTCSFGKFLIGDKEAHGKKIGVNATRAAIFFAFEKLGMNKIVLNVFLENIAAIKVYQEAGFHFFETHLSTDNRMEMTMIIKKGDNE